MEKIERIEPRLEPVRKTVIVRRTPAEAFEVFTSRFAAWWPYTKFSLHQAETAQCVFEARPGGAIYEVAKNGERGEWGKVLVWEPPARFVMAWHPGQDPAQATEVELRFIAVHEGTRVELEHRDWIKLGTEAAQARASYEGGWAYVFEQCYLEACS